MTKLIHASSTEYGDSGWNGKAKAGDQTGKEVCVIPFYSKPWNVMLRYPNTLVSSAVMKNAYKLATCNLVGYDQSQRNTLYQALKKHGFNVDAYITSGEKTETDCSAFVYACWCTCLPELRSDENAPRTATMRKFFKSHGFLEYTTAPYLTDSGFLLNGDIMLKEGEHTGMTYIEEVSQTLNPAVDNALSVIARDVIAGNWGNGEARKENLYRAIQNRVNDMLK